MFVMRKFTGTLSPTTNRFFSSESVKETSLAGANTDRTRPLDDCAETMVIGAEVLNARMSKATMDHTLRRCLPTDASTSQAYAQGKRFAANFLYIVFLNPRHTGVQCLRRCQISFARSGRRFGVYCALPLEMLSRCMIFKSSAITLRQSVQHFFPARIRLSLSCSPS